MVARLFYTRMRFPGTATAVGLISTVSLLSPAAPARAGCNYSPGTAKPSRAVHGHIDRPFAGPDDLVEVGMSPACDGAAAGLDESVVTIVFEPPAAERTIVVLADSCIGLDNALAACRES